MPWVTVAGVPPWVDAARLLGEGDWAHDDTGWQAELDRPTAADVAARLRGLGMGGAPLTVTVRPKLKRKLVRDARTRDARRRRRTTPGFTRREARLDDEGRRSLTPEALALALGEEAVASGVRSVVDAFAGAGGNAIGFARAGCQVTAIERHRGRAALARHNCRVYGVRGRVDLRASDALALLPSLSADLLFLDPPWGAYDKHHTQLSDLPLLSDVLPLASPERFDRVWLKLPPSFDPSQLPGFRPEAVFGQAAGDHRRVKFVLLRRAGRGSIRRG